MRLDDAVTYFLGQWPAEGPCTATVHTYAGQLKWLVKFAAERRKVWLSDLTPELLRAGMAAKMEQKSRSDWFKGGEASAHSLACAARKMARWLLAQGVPVVDLSMVTPPKPPERIQPRVHQGEFVAIESAILKRLVGAGNHLPRALVTRDLALIYMLADAGLRASEVCAMQVRSIDFERGAVLVVRSSGKGKKERALSIVDPEDRQGGVTLRLLHDWIKVRESVGKAARHQSLWVSIKGRPLTPTTLRQVLERICKDAGLDERRPPHTFRRASFTEAYMAQPTAIRVLASRMGWSPKSHGMIDVYTRGAEVDLARDTPIESVSRRWNSQNGPSKGLGPRPILYNGAVAGGRKVADRPMPTPARTDMGTAGW